MTCTCANCHKQQSWSTHTKHGASFTMFILGIIMLIMTLINLRWLLTDGPMALLLLLLPIPLILPHAVILIRNYKDGMYPSQTDEKHLPKITIKDPNIIKRAEAIAEEMNKSGAEREYLNFIEQEKYDMESTPDSGEWKCPSCWRMNKNSVTMCDCGTLKPNR